MKKIILLFFSLCAAVASHAQVSSDPFPLQEFSKDVKIFFYADQGNRGLIDMPATTKIYAHTWAQLSNGQQVGAPNWNASYPDKFQLTYVSPNVWQLYIGDIREFYGVTDSNVLVERLGFVFRNADASKTGRAAGDADIFLDVVDSGLQVMLQSDISGQLIMPSTDKINFTVGTTEKADITLSVNGTQIAAGNGTSLTADYTLSDPGNYLVKATATDGNVTVSDSITYLYAVASAPADYISATPVMGPVANADGTVTFTFAAPGKSNMILVGAWNDYALDNSQVMNYTEVENIPYFWTTVSDLDPDKMYGYYFIIDGSIIVSDPYARLILDPWNDKYLDTNVFPGLPEYPYDHINGIPLAVYQGNINQYDWEVEDFVGPDQNDLIIYELLLRDFTGTEGKALGNGTIRQAIEKIPYLLDLHVNAIELLPIMDFSGNNSWGYNPNFYFAPDKAYGTPDDYKEFIDLCHKNGIAVILDMVFNQTDGLHPWYQMYLPGQNPFYNLNAPHDYSVLNDWNQGFPLVQQQWYDVIQYWLTEYKFDGFRFDLVKGLGDNDSYASPSAEDTNAYNQSRIDRMIQLQTIVKKVNPNAYFINEDLATAKEENAMAEYGQMNWANINSEGGQFAMGFQSNSNLNRFYAPFDSNRLWGSTVSYLESHDEERLAYKQNMWGAEGVKGNTRVSMQRLGSAAAQMIMTPGAHMIWQFSELGNAQSTKIGSNNDTGAKVVNWSLLDEPNHRGLYNSYRQLIAIRNLNKEMFTESADFSMKCSASDWSAGRSIISKADGKELYTVINPNVTGTIRVTVPFESNSNDNYYIMAQSYDCDAMFNASQKNVTVPPNCFVVIGSKTLDGTSSVEVETPESLAAHAESADIVIDRCSDMAHIFAVDGTLVGRARQGQSVSVVPGIYIVRDSEDSLKLIVR